MHKKRNFQGKSAFTLAEVLITLGIVGVVAAMTLPMLLAKYYNRVTETGLKKFYSIMNQAILQSKYANGDFEGWSYWISEETDDDGNRINKSDETDASFQKYLAPYIKILDKREVTDGDGNKRFLYFLADGSAFAYQYHENREIIFFPKNAEKCMKLPKAESFGVCAFAFQFYPIVEKEQWKYLYQKGMEAYLSSWDGEEDTLYEGNTYSCSGTVPNYCTAIIYRNGWIVPDNYPRSIKY